MNQSLRDKLVVELLCSPEILSGETPRERLKRLELAERVAQAVDLRMRQIAESWDVKGEEVRQPPTKFRRSSMYGRFGGEF